MSATVVGALLNAATKLSERTSHNGCAGSPKPPSRAVVRVVGPTPFRVLVLGSGPVVGFGVLAHELALGGHLARRIAESLGSGIDLDVATEPGLHARELRTLTTDVVAERYDLVILSAGMQDVLDCTSLDDWSTEVEGVLDFFRAATERVIPVQVIAVPQISKIMGLDDMLAHAADGRVESYNARLRELCAARAGFDFVHFPLDGEVERCHQRTSDTYRRWADTLMEGIVPALGSMRHGGRPNEREELRQAALDRLRIVELASDELFDSISRKARRMLGTAGAGISLVDGDRQWFASSSGVAVDQLPRDEAICDHTIRTNHGFIVENAAFDPRFAEGFFVKTAQLRSYAGVPIREPSGYMIGALCVYDDKPRTFLPAELTLLRYLAHTVEERLLTLV